MEAKHEDGCCAGVYSASTTRYALIVSGNNGRKADIVQNQIRMMLLRQKLLISIKQTKPDSRRRRRIGPSGMRWGRNDCTIMSWRCFVTKTH